MKKKDNVDGLEVFTIGLFIFFILILVTAAWLGHSNPESKIPLQCREQCRMFNETPYYINGTCKCFLSICNTYLNGTVNSSSCKST